MEQRRGVSSEEISLVVVLFRLKTVVSYLCAMWVEIESLTY